MVHGLAMAAEPGAGDAWLLIARVLATVEAAQAAPEELRHRDRMGASKESPRTVLSARATINCCLGALELFEFLPRLAKAVSDQGKVRTKF
jgi:hypothetical protein